MQLDCGRHHIAGYRADKTCTKCAKRHATKGTVDTDFSKGHLFLTTSNGAQGHRLPSTTQAVETHSAVEVTQQRSAFGDSRQRNAADIRQSLTVVNEPRDGLDPEQKQKLTALLGGLEALELMLVNASFACAGAFGRPDIVEGLLLFQLAITRAQALCGSALDAASRAA